MKFEEALVLLRNGKAIRRKVWKSGAYVCYNGSHFICRFSVNGEEFTSTDVVEIDLVELLADDWEEYKTSSLLTEKEINFLQEIIYTLTHHKIVNKNEIQIRVYINSIGIESNKEDDEDKLEYLVFDKGKMFDNLEVGGVYTLEELLGNLTKLI